MKSIKIFFAICTLFYAISCDKSSEDTTKVIEDNNTQNPKEKDDTPGGGNTGDNMNPDGGGGVTPNPDSDPNMEEMINEGGDSTEGADGKPRRDNNITFGNPSNATLKDPNNYFLSKSEYTVSYNNSKGHPNWVSWHLSSAWQGAEGRCDCFQQDMTLPKEFNVITENSYSGSGFQRGHLTASSDRDTNAQENESTYLMTNIAPQSVQNNTGPWVNLEIYLRRQLGKNEVFIIAGGHGTGGTGFRGYRERISDGLINVPASFWKVALIIPNGANDISRVSNTTRFVAVNIPNNTDVIDDWRTYQTSIDEIEALTGYDFFENIPDEIENVLESKTSNE